jgi:hypothetical protein
VKLVGLVVLLAALSVSAASAGRRQEAGSIVFASNRTETLIPTEVRAFDLTRRRSTRVSIVPRNLPEDMVWSPNGRALAYVDGVSDLYVLQHSSLPGRTAPTRRTRPVDHSSSSTSSAPPATRSPSAT